MISENKLYELGSILGLKNKDVIDILRENSTRNEKESQDSIVFQAPLDTYIPGTLYGTVSINDF